MTQPNVSVVVVSQGRPESLARCVLALSQLFYTSFEVIVVADPVGLAAVARWAGRIKTVPLEVANISLARNLGIAQAGGEIVAFIDDDAVPEPTWLDYLSAPFSDPTVAAVGGYVRGRNGISYQWKARIAGPEGQSEPIDVPFEDFTIPEAKPGWAVKTEGTNMAVRREVLFQHRGFDPAFRFYLDDTDLNMRLGRAGHLTAIAPLAQVHHAYAASDRRRADRVPRDLTEVGASLAVYLRKHSGADHEAVRKSERRVQRRRLVEHMVQGRIEPRDIRKVLRSFDAGWRDGQAREIGFGGLEQSEAKPFRVFPTLAPKKSLQLAGWRVRGRTHVRNAAEEVARGNRATLYLFSLFPLRHTLCFTSDGYWLQTGGLAGKADREASRSWLHTFSTRAAKEGRRVARFRQHRL